MPFKIEFEPLLTLAVGVIILFFPKFLNYIVAAYFILIGTYGLMQ